MAYCKKVHTLKLIRSKSLRGKNELTQEMVSISFDAATMTQSNDAHSDAKQWPRIHGGVKLKNTVLEKFQDQLTVVKLFYEKMILPTRIFT